MMPFPLLFLLETSGSGSGASLSLSVWPPSNSFSELLECLLDAFQKAFHCTGMNAKTQSLYRELVPSLASLMLLTLRWLSMSPLALSPLTAVAFSELAISLPTGERCAGR
jgi:hypothetical protein